MDVDLGFYDQQEEENRYRPQQKTKKGSYFFTGLIGAVVGALLVILPYLHYLMLDSFHILLSLQMELQ